jgi:DNA helicase-2/ATP-dependent DNA helicase PcrA
MSHDYVLHSFRAPVNLQIDYAKELNAQQHAAVTALPGPALVIAGAGSGKTRTLTYRVAFLLEQGVSADRILLLTFTNKAAREMMRRVADLLGGDVQSLWGGTFHAIGARVLRRHAEQLGFRRDFTIMDREDSSDLLKTCIAEAQIDVKATRFPKADVLADVFSMAVNTRKTIPELLQESYRYFVPLAPQISEVNKRYTARKRAANVMDFDDLLVLWLRLLQENDEIREQYQRRFQFVLVDEYQDTNKLQADLIDLLAERHKNVMVVGDDSQSIYAWRGANFRNILEFPKRYPDTTIYKIETNYRSTPEILSLANAAIAPNVHQFTKELAPARKSGDRPVLVACQDSRQQAAFIAQRVLELRDEGIDLNQTAVLYRSHFHALELQLELTRRNIPFSITSGIRFFEQAHIKDVAAYLKLVVNPTDELAFKRLVQMLPGIGGKGAEKLWRCFRDRYSPPANGGAGEQVAGQSLTTPEPGEGTGSARRPSSIATALQQCSCSVPKKTAVAWSNLVITISQLEADPLRNNPSGMLRHVIEAGYEEYLQDTFANYRNRLEDLEQLATFALQFKSTEEFLTQLSLLTNVEAEDNQPGSTDDEEIRLSTIHQAKGLEFDVVFVMMLCDGLFPSARSIETPEGEEEERRLFYVAITRARDELYLSYPLIRASASYGSDIMQQRSRFLENIPVELIDEWSLRTFDPYA